MKRILKLLVLVSLIAALLLTTAACEKLFKSPASTDATTEATTPVENPTETTPAQTTPVETPEVTTPVETPEVTTPVETPEVTTPVETPEVTTPVETPEETTPVETPEETTPVETPEETTPDETPDETTPAGCDHEWTPATCLVPKTCSKCGETEGSVSNEHVAGADATCTTAQTCALCGTELKAALGHTAGETVVENNVAADCENDGSYDNVVYCFVCGTEISRETITVDALGHTEVVDEAVEATCTTAGKTEGKHCSVCDKVLVAQEVVDALGHTWVDATCTAPKTCSVCQATDGEALGHEWVDATCTAPKTCSVCQATEGEKLAHAYSNVGICADCGNDDFVITVEEAIALGLTYEKGKYSEEYYYVTLTLNHQVNPNGFARAKLDATTYISVAGAYLTGDAQGSIGLYDTVTFKAQVGCVNSDMVVKGGSEARLFNVVSYVIVEKHEHTWVDATCTAPKTCSVCQATDGTALGHDIIIDEAVDATCTETGLTAGQHCSRCDAETVAQEIVEATGHSYGAVVTAPTCTEGGFTTYTCACGDTYVADEVEALGHTAGETVVENEVDPTCTVNGSYDNVVYCSVCDEELSRNTIVVDALGHSYEAVVTAPTCTEDGYTTYTCATCGDSYVADETDALGHNYEAVVTAPTCTEDGYTTYTCSVCGNTYVADETDALGHSYGAVVTAPTCTADGYTTYTCATCGDSYVADATDALGHSYGAVVTAPTCTADGYTTYTCATCGDSYVADETDALGHNYEAVVTAPTCTEDGYTTYTCSACDDTYVADATEALGHSYEAVVTAPTCTADGYTTYTCACGDTYTADTVDALGHTPGDEATCTNAQICTACNVVLVAKLSHDYQNGYCTGCGVSDGHTCNYEAVVTAPTCTEDGYTTYTCTICFESYVADETDALGHDYDAVVTAPTCTEAGYTTYTCSVCGDTYVADATDALGHDYDAVVTAPTCTEAGYTTYTCSVCGDTYVADATDALGHDYDAVVTAPTCTAGGYTTYTCSVCGNSYVADKTNATGHSYSAVVTAPTCTEAGYTTYTCSACGHSYVANEVAALGHTWTAANCTTPKTCSVCQATEGDALGHAWVAATCTEPKTCTTCGATEGNALGHTWVNATCTAPKTCSVCQATEGNALGHTWTAANCTTPKTCSVCQATEGNALGHTWTAANCTTPKTCSVCQATEGNALGHTWVNATCTAPKTCSVCGETEGNALGHDYDAVVTDPTCTEKGYTTYTCSVCGHSYVDDEVDAFGHFWDDATCTAPKTCNICNATTGTALGHQWKAATCTTPKTCSTCQGTEGVALGHTAGAAATCTTAQTCTTCGAQLTAALGHTWVNATCETPKTCSACGATEGDALGHAWVAATCTEPKTCTTCGATEGDAVGHKWGPATCETPSTCAECDLTQGKPLGHSGNDVGVCTVCAKNLVISIDEAIEIGLSYANTKYSSEYYYIKLTITESVNTTTNMGFTRAKVRSDLYFSISGGYLNSNTVNNVKTGDTVIYKAKLGAAASNMVVQGGREPRLYEVASYAVVSNCSAHDYSDIGVCNICGHNGVISVEDAIAIGMTYDKTKYSTEYYYVQLTLDHQANSDGFARMTVSEGLYVTVAGGYLTGDAQGTIKQGNTVIFKAKLGAANSALTTGGKELRLYQVASYHITSQQHTHVYGDTITPVIPVTCGTDGTGTVACECGKTKTVVVPATKLHTPDSNFVCTVCGNSAILTVDEAIAMGMTYEKTKYSNEYYYVQLTLMEANTYGGFARAKIAEGLYVTVNKFLGDTEAPLYKAGDTVIFKAKLGAANSGEGYTIGGKELRLYEVAEYYIVANPNVSTTVDGKTNIATTHSSFASFVEVTKAPAGVTFDLGYLYEKNSGLTTLANTALVWNTNNTYKTISFDLYIDKIKDKDGNALTEVEFQISAGAAFASIVDANGNAVNVNYGDAPYVVLQKGQTYHIVVDVKGVATPAFSFGLSNQTGAAYFYNVSVSTTSIDQVSLVFVGGEKGGNTPIATLTGTIGDAIVLPADPTYPGFLFAGWYTDSECTTPFTETTYNNNMMVYAKWTLDPAQSLSVMSFNIKTGNNNKNLVIETIRANNPYVFGVQEADSTWMSYLKSQLGSTYSYVGEQRGGGILNSGSEHSAIFYRTDLFTLVEGGTKWLSQTPDVASKYSDGTNTANYNRIMTYVVLERKSDGARFIYVNTHLDNNGNNDGTVAENIRKGQVEILLQQIQVIKNKYGNLPTVVTGDFNTQGVANNTASYKAMLAGGFVDSSKVANSVEGEKMRTFNGNDDAGNVIFDYVFVSADWADVVETYKVCDEKINGTWVSDHNAIISTIVFPLTK